jgi:FkbM family methyltransferase
MQAATSDLVFDIGAHSGEDTDFYLGKGFRVVALEANPKLVSWLRHRFAEQLASGQLIVVEKAIMRTPGDPVSFFINEGHDDWSSLHEDVAKKGTMDVLEVTVPVTTLADLCDEFGVPYFLKVDIELGDAAVAESLRDLDRVPQYASFEFHEDRMLDLMYEAGYTEFQIINQWFNGFIQPLESAREGANYWPGGFGGFHSGYFGRDLPEEDWVDIDKAREWRNANNIACQYGLMKTSWFDLHGRTADARR